MKVPERPISVWILRLLPLAVWLVVALAAAQENASPKFALKPLALPGANGLVMLDYFAYDHAHRRL